MKYLFLLFSILLFSCDEPERSPLERAFMSAHPAMLNVLHDPGKYEVQILFTQVDLDENGNVKFTDHEFRRNDSAYFYPASSVKLPMAVLAAEYLDTNDNISIDTQYGLMKEGGLGHHSVDDDIRQIFAVSDNQAFNRLYELLGRDYFNTHPLLTRLGPARLAHRLEIDSASSAIRRTLLFSSGRDTIFHLGGGIDSSLTGLELRGIKKGKAHIRNGKKVNLPMDFSKKNYLPLRTQHELLKRLIIPEIFDASERFSLKETTRRRLLEHMKAYPRQAGFDASDYPDNYVKYFMYGDSEGQIPEQISIYNKVGQAYGTITETAYIEDSENDIRFFLSATILVNENAIFNDDSYEYDEIGIPFMAQLGRELYMYERARK